jgi:hypothetical protein
MQAPISSCFCYRNVKYTLKYSSSEIILGLLWMPAETKCFFTVSKINSWRRKKNCVIVMFLCSLFLLEVKEQRWSWWRIRNIAYVTSFPYIQSGRKAFWIVGSKSASSEFITHGGQLSHRIKENNLFRTRISSLIILVFVYCPQCQYFLFCSLLAV